MPDMTDSELPPIIEVHETTEDGYQWNGFIAEAGPDFTAELKAPFVEDESDS